MGKPFRTVTVIAAVFSVCTAMVDIPGWIPSEHIGQCVSKTGVNMDDVRKIMVDDFSVTDKRIECFVKCYLEAEGYINAEGQFLDGVIEKLTEGVDKDHADALINNCRPQVGKSPCETVYKIYKCSVNFMNH